MDELEAWAREQAAALPKAQLPRRWSHVQGVADRARVAAPMFADSAPWTARRRARTQRTGRPHRTRSGRGSGYPNEGRDRRVRGGQGLPTAIRYSQGLREVSGRREGAREPAIDDLLS